MADRERAIVACGGIFAQLLVLAAAWPTIFFVVADGEIKQQMLGILARLNLLIIATNVLPVPASTAPRAGRSSGTRGSAFVGAAARSTN